MPAAGPVWHHFLIAFLLALVAVNTLLRGPGATSMSVLSAQCLGPSAFRHGAP